MIQSASERLQYSLSLCASQVISSQYLTSDAVPQPPEMTTTTSAVFDDFQLRAVDRHKVHAPVLQLFENDIMGLKVGRSRSDESFLPSKPLSAQATAIRRSLMSLLPPRDDMKKLVHSSLMWWVAWQTEFPGICDKCLDGQEASICSCDCPVTPAEVAKVLLCLTISVEQLPSDFDYNSLSIPFEPAKFMSRCITDIERLIIHDDEFASNLTGMECLVLLSKHYMNQGRLRKAWLTTRRAINFAQLAGIHISIDNLSVISDAELSRSSKMWCSSIFIDRFLSLILGLPCAIPSKLLNHQIDLNLPSQITPSYIYMSQLSLVLGKLIDYNQDRSDQPLSEIFRLDEELESMISEIPEAWQRMCPSRYKSMDGKCYEAVMLQFIHHVVKAFLHLPQMLSSTANDKFQCCRLAALESSRASLLAYKEFRLTKKRYLCKLVDFLAFTMAMLLVVNSVRFPAMQPTQIEQQVNLDINLVEDTIAVLVRAGTETGGSMASDFSRILQQILDKPISGASARSNTEQTCTISLPYFGKVTICSITPLARQSQKQQTQARDPTRIYQENQPAHQLSRDPSPALKDPLTDPENEFHDGQVPGAPQVQNSDKMRPHLEEFLVAEDTGLGLSTFFNELGQGLWPDYDMNGSLDNDWGFGL
ncbi:hypothetical protein BDW67DRAFT_188792 [Aspergillus spinulosporus]